MRRLLSAGLVRLLRCKVLWFSCGLMAVLEAVFMLTRWREGLELGYFSSIDGGFFLFCVPAGLLAALVCAFFIGPEHGDGTVRNKLVTGCARRDVYLAELLLASLAALVMCLAAILPALALGLPLLGGFHMGAARAVVATMGVCAMAVAYAAIFTLLMMLVDRRAAATAAALVLAVALLGAGGYLNGRLSAPPTVQGYQLAINGELAETDPMPNPDYLPDGPSRNAFQFLCDFIPGGQTIQYASLSARRPAVLMAYDGVIVLLSTAAGLTLFQRRDLQ